MRGVKDHYKTLGVKRSVDDCGIRTAFRELAKKCHPDVSGPEKTREFQEIVEAYSVLSDPESRVCYNRILLDSECRTEVRVKKERGETFEGAAALRTRRSPFGASRAEEIFDLFEYLMGWGRGSRPSPGERPPDIEVELSREEAGRGGILPIPCPALLQCRSCGGAGRRGRWSCASCNGRGIVEGKETIRIKIPAGVIDGTTFEVSRPGVFLIIRIRVSQV